jgi:hypothetical protein
MVTLLPLVLSVSCGSPAGTMPMPIDLLRELPRAKVQAPASSPGARQDFVPGESGLVPALVMTAPARVTYTLRFAERAEIAGRIAVLDGAGATAGVTLRVGISDSRRYRELLRLPVAGTPGAPRWQEILVDLSPYSGLKLSLFYQPARRDWSVIINADATPGGTVALDNAIVRRRSGPHF